MSSDQRTWTEGYRKSPTWLRLLGGSPTYYADRGSYRLPWGELSLRRSGLGLRVTCYEDAHLNIALGFGQAFIRLPFLDEWMRKRERDGDCPSYGFCTFGGSLHLNWGLGCKIINPPWQPWFGIREYLDHNGEWRPRVYSLDGAEAPRLTVEHPYHYMLDSGVVQHVTATLTRERVWPAWLWFGTSGRLRKAPVSDALRRLQRRFGQPKDYIEIRFSAEVGGRAGSWKGGCLGCSYEMQPGERPEDALRRMQRERRFR